MQSLNHELSFKTDNFEIELRRALGIYDRPIRYQDTAGLECLDTSIFCFGWEDAELLRFFPNVKRLDIEMHTSQLYSLKYLPNLEDLSIVVYGEGNVDFRHFLCLPNLSDLFVSGGDISDINFENTDVLPEFLQLRSLWFHEFGTVDLSFLSRMPWIEFLGCGWADNILHPECIGDLCNLKKIALIADKFDNIDFFNRLPSTIDIEFSAEISKEDDIDILQRFKNKEVYDVKISGKRIYRDWFQEW